MWEQLIKIITAIVIPLSGLLVIYTIHEPKIKLITIKNIILIIVLTILTLIVYRESYSGLTPIFMFVFSIFIYKLIFDIPVMKSLIYSSIYLLLMFITEAILSIGIMQVIDITLIRSNSLLFLGTNILTGTIEYLIVKIPKVKKFIYHFDNILDKNNSITVIFFICLSLTTICIIFSVIYNNYRLNDQFIISLLAIIAIFFLLFVFMKEQEEYEQLNKEFAIFISYVTELENWIETAQLEKHEYKNSLAILRTKTKDKKVIGYIDEMLVGGLQIDTTWLSEIKNLPSGIKGLIYYKIILAKNNNINFIVNVSHNCLSFFNTLNNKTFKNICYLIGIYLDNAMEAAKDSNAKSMSIEIYVLKNDLNIVISNSYKTKPNLEKINQKGFSTKGKEHGKGLYFAKIIIDQNQQLISKQRVLNDFYIQQLIVKSDN